eukprot:TRINITY_DN7370_c1_g3_i1.p1 TRINITY_DN7370_c1_g3~~TRINITY_DN7370_c1_g3_i1.p1  ORF type:complete len:643 (+),score=151.46 TRINITY_DN7370_c1_g3_i1:62-1930(+)
MAPGGRQNVVAGFALLCIAVVRLDLGEASFLRHSGDLPARKQTEQDDVHKEIRRVMSSALGCGAETASDKQKLLQIREELLPMWHTMPLNSYGRVERSALRYLAHRYFVRKWSIWLRGLDPLRQSEDVRRSATGNLQQTNASSVSARLFGNQVEEMVPRVVERWLESQLAGEHGFDLQDVVHLVAKLQEVVADTDRVLLEHVYKEYRAKTHWHLHESLVQNILEAYLAHWYMSDSDERIVFHMLRNRTLMRAVVPHWEEFSALATGMMRALDYKKQRAHRIAGDLQNAGGALTLEYSFEDVHSMVYGLTQSFSYFWRGECEAMRSTLIGLDTSHTGRVPLSRFYRTGAAQTTTFTESPDYLDELGALDGHVSLGLQVIVPNYVNAATNCIITTRYYMICCPNECEDIFRDIETAFHQPAVRPEELVPVVGNITLQLSLDDEETPQVQGRLLLLLQEIADVNNGSVPLRGRLFAQWLHYVFPRHCPYPHVSGKANSLTPVEYGQAHRVSTAELHRYFADDSLRSAFEDVGALEKRYKDMDRFFRWDESEDLVVDYLPEPTSKSLEAPWHAGLRSRFGPAVELVMVTLMAFVAILMLLYSPVFQKTTEPALFGGSARGSGTYLI